MTMLRPCGFLLVILLCHVVGAEEEGYMLYMPDAGRRMNLGSLWDARTHQPVHGFLWDQDTIQRNTVTTPIDHSRLEAVFLDDFRSKTTLTSVSLEFSLEVNLLLVSAKVTCSMNYLTDKKRTTKVIRMTTGFTTRTVKETMDAFDGDPMRNMNKFALGYCGQVNPDSCKHATHVVTGVTYGANVYGVFETGFEDEKTKISNTFKLKIKVSALGIGVGIEESKTFTDDSASSSSYTTVSFFGDIIVDEETPRDPEGAAAFIRCCSMLHPCDRRYHSHVAVAGVACVFFCVFVGVHGLGKPHTRAPACTPLAHGVPACNGQSFRCFSKTRHRFPLSPESGVVW